MTEAQLHILPVEQVKIPEDRQRREFLPEKLHALAESILANGLLQPIVVRDGGILVSGERRLRAIRDTLPLLAERYKCGETTVAVDHIPTLNLGELSPLAAMEAEYEENVCRADLTWQERSLAVARLADLRNAQRGAPVPLKELAMEIRESDSPAATHVIQKQIILAQHMDQPEIKKATSLDDAWKALKAADEANLRSRLAISVGAVFGAHLHRIICADCLIWLETEAPREAFDVILTDPPYGINSDQFSNADGRANQPHEYDDSPEAFDATIIKRLPGLLWKVAKPQAHLYLFCDIEHFLILREAFRTVGWRVHRTPFVRYILDANRAPWPKHGPRRAWDMILYAIKGDRETLSIRSDIVSSVMDVNWGHGAQKPVAPLKELLVRSARMGDTVLDPFVGTGSTIVAAHELKLIATGIEINPVIYGGAIKRLSTLT